MNGVMRAGVCSALFFLAACGTLQISVEGTPTADMAATGTVGALQTQNADLATRIAQISPPVVSATPFIIQPTGSSAPATTESPGATRITFLSGATVGIVTSPIQAGQTQDYVLQAEQGQPMFVYVGSQNGDVTVSIRTQDGTSILNASDHRISWQGILPQTQDYYMTIHGGATTENFSLTVTVPSRIQFADGAVSASVDGKTVAGYDVSYTLLANKGQTMRVDLENISGRAALTIYGFTDGQYYARSGEGQTSSHFVLPMRQDYIIVVAPRNGTVVNYSLTVKVQ